MSKKLIRILIQTLPKAQHRIQEFLPLLEEIENDPTREDRFVGVGADKALYLTKSPRGRHGPLPKIPVEPPPPLRDPQRQTKIAWVEEALTNIFKLGIWRLVNDQTGESLSRGFASSIETAEAWCEECPGNLLVDGFLCHVEF